MTPPFCKATPLLRPIFLVKLSDRSKGVRLYLNRNTQTQHILNVIYMDKFFIIFWIGYCTFHKNRHYASVNHRFNSIFLKIT